MFCLAVGAIITNEIYKSRRNVNWKTFLIAEQYNFVFSEPEPEHDINLEDAFIFKNTSEMLS